MAKDPGIFAFKKNAWCFSSQTTRLFEIPRAFLLFGNGQLWGLEASWKATNKTEPKCHRLLSGGGLAGSPEYALNAKTNPRSNLESVIRFVGAEEHDSKSKGSRPGKGKATGVAEVYRPARA